MPRFRVRLSAVAIVEGALEVVADSPEDAEDEARKRLGDVSWEYEGLNGEPVEVLEITERHQQGGTAHEGGETSSSR